jgi:hypothetical protein
MAVFMLPKARVRTVKNGYSRGRIYLEPLPPATCIDLILVKMRVSDRLGTAHIRAPPLTILIFLHIGERGGGDE